MEASHTLVISLEEAKSLVIKHVNPDPNMITAGDGFCVFIGSDLCPQN